MSKRHEYESVKASFEKEGYTLLSKEYKNNITKLNYSCPKGHFGAIRWHAWSILGQRCKQCYNENRKHMYIDVKKNFEVEGYVLLSEKYEDANSLLKYRCSENHIHETTFGHWGQGVRCPTCHKLSIHGSGHWNWQGGLSFEPYCEVWKDKDFKEDIKKRDGYKCLNPYCDSKNSEDLTIHHVDYNKKNCLPNNLITICRSCNCKANFDRRWHKAWYKAILNKRYDNGSN